jgi:hypothetical protein
MFARDNGPMRTGLGLAACAVGALVSCGFDLPPPSYVTQTEIAAVRQTVELGPLFPSRAGPLFAYDDEIPIAEALPGDLALLDTIVIDVDGVRLPADEVETLWVQCGISPCERSYEGFAAEEFGVSCAELASSSEYTTNSYCVLGSGGAQFEFVAPELAEEFFSGSIPSLGRRVNLYGVVAWGGRRAADCWAQRRADRAALDDCEFIEQNITYGPEWALFEHARMIFDYPTPAVPSLDELLELPANRIPRAPELSISVDGELVAEGRPPLSTVAIQPGSEIEIGLTFDVTSQLVQGAFSFVTGGTWEFEPELIHSRTLTTNAIRRFGPELVLENDATFHYGVDESASPGVSRVLIGWRDTRRGNDILTVEFEIE